mgnify:CR=1 FL=1
MKSKTALQDIRDYRIEIVKKLDIIEKDLEILEIIKKHKLLNYVLKNEKCANMYHLSKEEIDLLREIENGNDWICYNTRNQKLSTKR